MVGTQRFELKTGETFLGGQQGKSIPVPGLTSPSAVFFVTPDGGATIRRAGAIDVYVNGVAIDSTRVVLSHGARIDAAGVRMLFGDIRAQGNTMHMAGVSEDHLALLASLVLSEETGTTGGRLTARRDGTVHPVPDGGLDIGRDLACGIVLASKNVSRRHARIAPGVLGYVLSDLSANGVMVNGARVDGTRLLGQRDIVRIGDEEWVFEADSTQMMPTPAPAPVQPAAAVSSAPAPAPAPLLLSTLEIINPGLLNGTRFRIERPLMHIGRGAHNDIQLRDESVSSSHATLARRGTEWVVTDRGSTNGTYVDGERITGERVLKGACELRFGGIKTVFRPIAGSTAEAMATRVMTGVKKD